MKTLRESPCRVAILATGPLTNLAVALTADPSIVSNILAVFIMGSAYDGPNNVYTWQMTFNNILGACTEAGFQNWIQGESPLDLTRLEKLETAPSILKFPVAYSGRSDTAPPRYSSQRPGCRGIDMTAKGNTEWNLFMDALAWREVMHFLKGSKADVYVLATNASLDMNVTLPGMNASAAKIKNPVLRTFMMELAKSFLSAGEAKWWDAQVAVMMAEVMTGSRQGVCAGWALSRRAAVSLLWRSRLDSEELLPYGSLVDNPQADAPKIDFCLYGNVTRMDEAYWSRFPRLHSS